MTLTPAPDEPGEHSSRPTFTARAKAAWRQLTTDHGGPEDHDDEHLDDDVNDAPGGW